MQISSALSLCHRHLQDHAAGRPPAGSRSDRHLSSRGINPDIFCPSLIRPSMSQQQINEDQYLETLRVLHRKAWPKDLAREIVYPHGEKPLTEYLRTWARLQPDKPAVIFYGAVTTYGDLDRQSDRFAALLSQQGVKKGDRVSVFMPNCPQFHIAFFGILKLGAVHCPVSPLSKAFELGYQVGDCGSETIVALDQLMPVGREAVGETKLGRVIVDGVCGAMP